MEDRVRSMGMEIVRRGAVDARRRSVVIAANDRARTAPEIDLAGCGSITTGAIRW